MNSIVHFSDGHSMDCDNKCIVSIHRAVGLDYSKSYRVMDMKNYPNLSEQILLLLENLLIYVQGLI